MLRFATLGPQGSNHEWVTTRYLEFHRLHDARVALFPDFDAAFESMLRGDTQHVIQVAVHSSVATTVARYRGRAHLIDAFISPSQPMAVLTRSEIDVPASLGLQMATREYVDSSCWETLVPEASTVDVARGLLDGRYDSGITLSRFAREHPGRFRVDEEIGAVVDAWLVYGTRAVDDGAIQAWPDGPAARLFGAGTGS
jgi:hypothetical protein